MRIVTVARKPLSEGTVAANVLTHGCGALNIDAGRISAVGEDITNHARRTPEDTIFKGWSPPQDTHQTSGQKLGRWPANLILQHLAGCVLAGTQEVKAKQLTAGRRTVAWGVGHGDSTYEKGTGAVFATESGMDQIPLWECQKGCPIPELDSQSGLSTSSGGRISNISTTSTIYGGGKGLGMDLSPESVKGNPGLGDTGGASRYFKQIKKPE